MPKITFLNLPEGKKKRIIDAAGEEIGRVPIGEMSINKIVQAAGISRGSFYQYFEDKHDLVQYLLIDYIKIMKEGIRQTLRECGGDVFSGLEDVMKKFVDIGKKSNADGSLRHIISEIQPGSECSMEFLLGLEKDIIKIIIEEVNREILKDGEDEKVETLAKLLICLMKGTTGRLLYDFDNAEAAIEEFKCEVNIVKIGAVK